MLHTTDIISKTFRDLVKTDHAPIIMQIIPALKSGGVEQGVVDTNAAIVKAGGKSIVVSSGGVRVYEIVKAGGTHIDMSVHSKNPLVMARNIFKLRKLIREMNVDVVHACSRAPAWIAAKAVQGTTARYITSCHAAHKAQNKLKRFYNSSVAGGELVITVSNFLAGLLQQDYGVNPKILRTVHRGVALGKFHPNLVTPERLIKVSQSWRVPEGSTVVMLPARITSIKGHKVLLDAISQLRRKDMFCLFLGADQKKGNYRRELEGYIESKNMGSAVRIVTNCTDMPAAYMLSTVVVSPSLVPEGFGRIPIEAQAMGRPVIATDHGGARETILRDETGWLVTPNDANALASALEEALSLDQRERAGLATRAMAHVAKNFTNEKMCASTLDVYAEVLSKESLLALPANDVDMRKVG